MLEMAEGDSNVCLFANSSRPGNGEYIECDRFDERLQNTRK